MYKLLLVLFGISLFLFGCDKKDNPADKSNPPVNLDNRTTGSSAHELLSAQDYEKLVVEIDYMPGYKLKTATVDNLKNFLNKYLHKPEGIEIIEKQINTRGVQNYSIDDIRIIEENNRDNATRDKVIAVHVQIVDAPYSGNTNNSQVLGIAYKNTSLVLFGETIHDLSNSSIEPARDKLETTVLNHEFGHIMGLVNIGSPMQHEHQDEQHGAHCDDPDCLMHYTAETDDVVNNILTGGKVLELDTHCRADLKANGGK